jgi:hypothetical protein
MSLDRYCHPGLHSLLWPGNRSCGKFETGYLDIEIKERRLSAAGASKYGPIEDVRKIRMTFKQVIQQ